MLDDLYVRPVDAKGIEVTLDVREERIRKRIRDVEVTSIPSSVTTHITPTSVRVEVEGPRSLVEPLVEEDFELRVNVEGLEPGVHQLTPVLAFLREELAVIEALSYDPAQVRVRIIPPEQK
jgi:YbbR domain-containing protein